MSFLGRNTVYLHCSSNCGCQIKILGHIEKHCLSMETGSLETGGGRNSFYWRWQRSSLLLWGVDLKMTGQCEQYWEDLTVSVYPAGRRHASVAAPTRGFIGTFLMVKSNFGALQNHNTVVISLLSFNMSCRDLICNPEKLFYDSGNNECSPITGRWLQEIQHWIRNNFFFSFLKILGIIKLDMLTQVFQLVVPLLSWNGRRTNFSEVWHFWSLKIG